MTIYITAHEHQIIKKILGDYDYVFFGSRVKGTHSTHSDLDICIMNANFTLPQLAKLKQALSDSDIPYKVDLVVFEDLSPSFQELIKREGIKPA